MEGIIPEVVKVVLDCDKQAYSNSLEYKQIKHGWTKEQFDTYNKSRATTKKSLIEKYGEQEGTQKWKEYCNKQSYAGCKLEYFIEKMDMMLLLYGNLILKKIVNG